MKIKINLYVGIACAILLHAGVILFGGALFKNRSKTHGTLQQVELLRDDDVAGEKEKPKELELETEEKEAEDVPDAGEIVRNLEISAAANAPELEAASLSSIEAALSGQAGGGDFADALSLSSGGRIGGTGKAGALGDGIDSAFNLAEIDQKPRPIFQTAPVFPHEMCGKKLEGVVSILFVVDSDGKVTNPRIEKSTHPAFEKPALDAIKQWKFEPAIKAGRRVSCKMRASIRFQPG